MKIMSGNAFMLAVRAALGITTPAQRIIIDAKCDNIVTIYMQLLGDDRLLSLDLEMLLKDADVTPNEELPNHGPCYHCHEDVHGHRPRKVVLAHGDVPTAIHECCWLELHPEYEGGRSQGYWDGVKVVLP